MNTREQLLDLFRRNGVTNIHADYSGYGDSGSIDNPTTTPPKQINMDAPFGNMPHPWRPNETMSRTVGEAITDIFYKLLEQSHPGWEINDGSQGEFDWDITTDKITLDHGENYTSTEHFSHEF